MVGGKTYDCERREPVGNVTFEEFMSRSKSASRIRYEKPPGLDVSSINRIAEAAGGLKKGATPQGLETELRRAMRVYEFWQDTDSSPTRIQRLNSLKRIKGAADKFISAIKNGGETAIDDLTAHDPVLEISGAVEHARLISKAADDARTEIEEIRKLWQGEEFPSADKWLTAKCLPEIFENFTGRKFGIIKDQYNNSGRPGGPGINFIRVVFQEFGLDPPTPAAIDKRWVRRKKR